MSEYRAPDHGAGGLRSSIRFRPVFFHNQPIAFKVLAIVRRWSGAAMAADEQGTVAGLELAAPGCLVFMVVDDGSSAVPSAQAQNDVHSEAKV